MKLYNYMPVNKLVEELEIRDKQIAELEKDKQELIDYVNNSLIDIIHEYGKDDYAVGLGLKYYTDKSIEELLK